MKQMDLVTLMASQKLYDRAACLCRSLPKQHVCAAIHRFELRAGNVFSQILADQEITGHSVDAADNNERWHSDFVQPLRGLVLLPGNGVAQIQFQWRTVRPERISQPLDDIRVITAKFRCEKERAGEEAADKSLISFFRQLHRVVERDPARDGIAGIDFPWAASRQ